jgi:hypothetical protein
VKNVVAANSHLPMSAALVAAMRAAAADAAKRQSIESWSRAYGCDRKTVRNYAVANGLKAAYFDRPGARPHKNADALRDALREAAADPAKRRTRREWAVAFGVSMSTVDGYVCDLGLQGAVRSQPRLLTPKKSQKVPAQVYVKASGRRFQAHVPVAVARTAGLDMEDELLCTAVGEGQVLVTKVPPAHRIAAGGTK